MRTIDYDEAYRAVKAVIDRDPERIAMRGRYYIDDKPHCILACVFEELGFTRDGIDIPAGCNAVNFQRLVDHWNRNASVRFTPRAYDLLCNVQRRGDMGCTWGTLLVNFEPPAESTEESAVVDSTPDAPTREEMDEVLAKIEELSDPYNRLKMAAEAYRHGRDGTCPPSWERHLKIVRENREVQYKEFLRLKAIFEPEPVTDDTPIYLDVSGSMLGGSFARAREWIKVNHPDAVNDGRLWLWGNDIRPGNHLDPIEGAGNSTIELAKAINGRKAIVVTDPSGESQLQVNFVGKELLNQTRVYVCPDLPGDVREADLS